MKKRYTPFEMLVLYEEQQMREKSIPEISFREDKIDLAKIKNRYTTARLQHLVKKMSKKGFYIPNKSQRKIDWVAYNNQINDIIDTLHFIKQEVDKVHIPKKRNQ